MLTKGLLLLPLAALALPFSAPSDAHAAWESKVNAITGTKRQEILDRAEQTHAAIIQHAGQKWLRPFLQKVILDIAKGQKVTEATSGGLGAAQVLESTSGSTIHLNHEVVVN